MTDAFEAAARAEAANAQARLLRRIHDACQAWTPPVDAVWGAPEVPGDDLVCRHSFGANPRLDS